MKTNDKAKLCFVLAVAIGSIGIFLGTYLHWGVLTISVPLSAMVFYVLLGERIKLREVIGANFSDSVYYLGFIFTLISLTATLYVYDSSAMDMNVLVSNFALALITSILGLSVRIFYSSFNATESDYRQAMLDTLEQETRKFIEHTQSANISLVVNQKEAIESIITTKNESAEQLSDIFKLVSASLNEGANSFKLSCENMSGGFELILNDMKDNLTSFEFPENWLTDKLSTPIENFVDRLSITENLLQELQKQQCKVRDNSGEVADNLESINNTLQSVESALKLFSNQIETNYTGLDSMVENQKIVQNINNVLTQTVEDLSKISLPVQKLSTNLNEFSETTSKLPKVIDTMASSLIPTLENLSAYTGTFENLGNIADSLNKGSIGLPTLLENLESNVHGISGIAELISNLEHTLQSFNTTLLKSTEPLSILATDAEANHDQIKAHREATDLLLKKVQNDTQEVTNFLLQATKYVVDRLEPQNG